MDYRAEIRGVAAKLLIDNIGELAVSPPGPVAGRQMGD
jgi:hypothetical protein